MREGSFALAYCALICVVLIALGALVIEVTRDGHKHLHCAPWIGGPTPVVTCDNGHAYQLQGHRIVDMGARSADPGGIPTR